MKKNLLCMAVLAASFTGVAMAQEFDDRWHLVGSAGIDLQSSERATDANPTYGIGIGRFFTPEWSLDFGVYSTNASFEANDNLNFSQYGAQIDLRRHFRGDAVWWPYLKAGVGIQRAEEEFNAFPSPNSPGERKDNNLSLDFGGGLQTNYNHVAMRLEAGIRTVLDDQSRIAPREDRFSDPYVKAMILIPLGARATTAPAVAPAPTPAAAPVAAAPAACETLDDDGDGVNNCIDKCPGSQAGQAIGPDGCVVPLTIDLRGVNFDFDRATLRPDAVTILNEAIEILKKYPQLRVEVAGHTDAVGTDAYNQALSERRARTVFDYLVGQGIDRARLVGPAGYGESRPIDSNETEVGRAKNRRTELNVQN